MNDALKKKNLFLDKKNQLVTMLIYSCIVTNDHEDGIGCSSAYNIFFSYLIWLVNMSECRRTSHSIFMIICYNTTANEHLQPSHLHSLYYSLFGRWFQLIQGTERFFKVLIGSKSESFFFLWWKVKFSWKIVQDQRKQGKIL